MAKKTSPKLFFMAGKIKWRGIPKGWEKPEEEAAYDALIKQSDFIVESDLQEFSLADSKTVKQDIQTMKKVLLEPYFRAAQNANHFQNATTHIHPHIC